MGSIFEVLCVAWNDSKSTQNYFHLSQIQVTAIFVISFLELEWGRGIFLLKVESDGKQTNRGAFQTIQIKWQIISKSIESDFSALSVEEA